LSAATSVEGSGDIAYTNAHGADLMEVGKTENDINTDIQENGESEERKTAIRLFKTGE